MGSRQLTALMLALAAWAPAARGEGPPYQRLLRGEDAMKAEALEKQTKELWAAGKFDEAVKPAEEALALRRRAQGAHWQVEDAARRVETLRRAASQPPEQRAKLAEAPGLDERAAELSKGGKYAEAEPLL